MSRIVHISVIGNANNPASSGVHSKVLAQIDAFNDLGHECKGLIGGSNINVCQSDNDVNYVDLVRSFYGYGFKDFFGKAYKFVTQYQPDVVYIRYPLAKLYFLKFVAKIKRENPHIIIVIEKQSLEVVELLSTFSLRNMALASQELFLRKYVLETVDYIVCVTEEIARHNARLSTTKTFVMGNGIESKAIETSFLENSNNDATLKLIFVGNLAKWTSLKDFIAYLAKVDFRIDDKVVILNIVGGGNDEDVYLRLSKSFENVIYHGFLHGQSLNDLIRHSDFCLGSFGNAKRGLSEGSNLKLRLYCALGIPFVYFDYDADFDNRSLNSCVLFRPAHTPDSLDFEFVLKHISLHKRSIINSIDLVEFAKLNLTWHVKLSKLIDELGL